ncbi:hypothetical protein CLU79DRAFT_591088 [Phycomyces nitens]|nr:hypothetical protein CLU79DRAFT_591088 [Phycomyces nitens]
MTTLQEFDLFAETTPEEEAVLQQRTQKYRDDQQRIIQRLNRDAQKRTMAENRFVFNHLRNEFTLPIHLHSLFSVEECNRILSGCQEMSLEQWNTTRHSAFTTTDIPIRNSRFDYLIDQVRDRLFPVIGDHYGFHPTHLAFRDIFIVKYSADAQAGLKLHTDGCLISFNVLINPQGDFDGGGTYFDSTKQIVTTEQGDCVFHGAHIMHRGVDITRGQRYLLVGFIDTVDTIEKDGTGSIRSI